MNIRFLDLETGKVFNGSKPYVFEMGNGESTGKWVSMPLVVCCDRDELEISFPDDSYFWLVDTSSMSSYETLYINDHLYYDLDSMKVHSMNVSPSYVNSGMYLYKINVLFISSDEGEFHDNLLISSTQSPEEKEEFEFSVDVYSEDERIPINLSNLGFDMPKQFQKAVYDSNVREETEDYILLNRKWKELLIEYWNVIANKGSYKSLINSLKFFEYGDLTKISEYWKYVDEFDNTKLIGRDIEQIISDDIRERMDALSKTTYIGLDMLVNGVKDGEYVSYPNNALHSEVNKPIPEPIPELEYLSLKWSIEDLALKMTLLANYFSTYFMPIHLDLIHSSIDRIVFTNCIKILEGTRPDREDHWDDHRSIECNLYLEDTYWIGNKRSYNYPDTVLRNSDTPTYWGDLSRIGIDPYVENRITFTEGSDDVLKYLNQYFGGVGAVVPVNARTRTSKFINRTRISIYRRIDDSNYELKANYESFEPMFPDTSNGQNAIDVSFNLLFTESGRYLVQLQFVDVDGSTSTGSWYINVNGSIGNSITVKRFRKIEYSSVEEEKMFDDWFYDNLDFNSFMFTEPFADQIKYKQWLVPTDGCSIDGIGMNQLLVIDCGPTGFGRPIRLTCNGETKDFTFSTRIAEDLSSEYPHYWWKLMVRNVSKSRRGTIEITDESRYYIVGVRKYFDSDGDNPREIFSDFVRTYKNGELDDLQLVLVEYVSSRSSDCRGYLQVTAPVGTTLLIDGCGKFECVSETTTIPVRKETVRISIDYEIGGHIFHKDLKVDSISDKMCNPEYIVHSEKKKGFTTIEESRFFPIFHKLEDIEGNKIKSSDTVVCIPDFRWVDKQVTDTYWEFVNATTGEIVYSKSFKENKDLGGPLYIEEPFVGKFDFKNSLSKGYYDIVLHFTMGGTEQTETVLSAFRIE